MYDLKTKKQQSIVNRLVFLVLEQFSLLPRKASSVLPNVRSFRLHCWAIHSYDSAIHVC